MHVSQRNGGHFRIFKRFDVVGGGLQCKQTFKVCQPLVFYKNLYGQFTATCFFKESKTARENKSDSIGYLIFLQQKFFLLQRSVVELVGKVQKLFFCEGVNFGKRFFI